MIRRRTFALGIATAVSLLRVVAGCVSSSNAPGSPDASPEGLSCQLGGACSDTQICMGGIARCVSNCQCLDGIWQAPCPANLPETTSACAPEGAECGYVTSTNQCGAAECSCKGGAWTCGPTCVIRSEDAGVDASGFPGTCVDAGPAPSCADAGIQAANYDQTCQTDSDCVVVGEGESCSPCSLACGPYGAIAHGALTQFEVDVARTPAGNLPVSCAPCCAPTPVACCRGGLCHADNQCTADAATVDAGAD